MIALILSAFQLQPPPTRLGAYFLWVWVKMLFFPTHLNNGKHHNKRVSKERGVCVPHFVAYFWSLGDSPSIRVDLWIQGYIDEARAAGA